MMPPKCILIAMGVLIVGSFLSGNTSAKPLEPEDSEVDMDDFNSDYSSVGIDSLPEENDVSDDEIEEAKDDVDEDIINDSEVEYAEEIGDEETKESEEKSGIETEESEEEETDKDEEIDIDEDSEESDEEDDDDEVTEKNEDDDDDKTVEKAEGKVLFTSDDGKDFVEIVQILDEDDSQKETKSASWLFNLQYKVINMMKGIRDPSTPKTSKNKETQKLSEAGGR
ncbi:uncharacterized protein [Parasteatoda tepidariorum]|uniref:uncharacterized protein isoform X2 n=1 Tax=Parasteatoda tepidariorum TaxID=114398 RepID=UPI0039BC543C